MEGVSKFNEITKDLLPEIVEFCRIINNTFRTNIFRVSCSPTSICQPLIRYVITHGVALSIMARNSNFALLFLIGTNCKRFIVFDPNFYLVVSKQKKTEFSNFQSSEHGLFFIFSFIDSEIINDRSHIKKPVTSDYLFSNKNSNFLPKIDDWIEKPYASFQWKLVLAFSFPRYYYSVLTIVLFLSMRIKRHIIYR